MADDQVYYYQRFQWKPIRLAKGVDVPDWHVFLNHIQMPDEVRRDFIPAYQYVLDNFSTHILGNIFWYEKKVVREKTLRLAYILVSLALLLLIPLLVALIQRNTNSLSAEITAIFTGFFALYQGFSKWLESRSGIAVYWQTKSNLKSRLYSLEDKWISFSRRGEHWTPLKREELANDLRQATLFGIESQKVEKQLFFSRYRYPQFAILSTILSVRQQVDTLFQRPKGQDAAEREQERTSSIIPPKVKLAQLTEEADQPTLIDHAQQFGDAANQRLHVHDARRFLAFQTAPQLITRAAWQAEPHRGPKAPLGPVKSIVIHHAAGYWTGEDPSQGSEQVRNIQQLHQGNNDWSDVGYHFLIDPKGRLYQGRAFLDDSDSLSDTPQLIAGAHVLQLNTGRIGVCLLGNFHPKAGSSGHFIAPQAEEVLLHLLTFLHLRYEPLGDTHPDVRSQTITGHRDYLATDCPGNNLYQRLPDWRTKVEQALMLLREGPET